MIQKYHFVYRMENIRNYKTNSKTKFVYFCQCENQNEENTDYKKPYKQRDEVEFQKIVVCTFING